MKSMKTTMQKISYILRFYRRRKEISQFEMSELLNISTRNYQRLEMGEVEPKLETISKICDILDLPIHSLFDLNTIDVYEFENFCSKNELKHFNEINTDSIFIEELDFIKMIIEKDKTIRPDHRSVFQAQVQGTTSNLNDPLAHFLKVPTSQIILDDHVLGEPIVERWELLHRLKLKQAVLQNIYSFPEGLKAFQVYHHSINSNPDNPRSECILRDITDRFNLEKWVKTKLSRKLLIA